MRRKFLANELQVCSIDYCEFVMGSIRCQHQQHPVVDIETSKSQPQRSLSGDKFWKNYLSLVWSIVAPVHCATLQRMQTESLSARSAWRINTKQMKIIIIFEQEFGQRYEPMINFEINNILFDLCGLKCAKVSWHSLATAGWNWNTNE